MMNSALRPTLEAWSQRANALDALLRRAGRDDLLSAVALLRNGVDVMGRSGEKNPAMIDALVRLVAEIKSCLLEGRPADRSVMEEFERTAGEVSLVASRAQLAATPTTHAPGHKNSWATHALSDIAGADDDTLNKMLDSLKRLRAAGPGLRSGTKDELGTLREPLNGNAGAEAARVLMKGELQPGLMADLIQLFAQNAETGCLFIDGVHVSASIYFSKGKIVDAVCREATGEKAFFQSMLIREGRFSYQRGVESEHSRIFRSAQHLIMDTLRLIDESA